MPQTQALSFALRTRALRRPSRYTIASTATSRLIAKRTICSLHLSRTSKQISRSHYTLSHQSRPQSPYLALPYRDTRLLPTWFRFVRRQYLSTARRERWRRQAWHQLRVIGYVFPILFALWAIKFGLEEIDMEHDFPTPVEWSYWSRRAGRSGQAVLWKIEKQGYAREGQWARAFEWFDALRSRLEEGKDGEGVTEQRDGDGKIMVDGLGKVGFDLSGKSEQWKQGYWMTLMGLAKVAEHLDGRMKRTGHKLTEKEYLYLDEHVLGPQNPRPVPVPYDKGGAHLKVPRVDEVEPAMDGPEVYYLKILTSKGFNNRQRLDAALAYADWCDFKGLKDTAGNMYDWAIDIAAGGLPMGADHVVDIQTGVINVGKEQFVSANLLKASTAAGVRHARHGEVKQALPILLSVLRARKALPPAPAHMSGQSSKSTMTKAERESQTGRDVFLGYLDSFTGFFRESNKLNLLSDGDERPFHSLKEACEEVGIMTYIGEILFATSEQEREKGLSWTRDSVDAAEAVLWLMDEQAGGTPDDEDEGRNKCRECLDTGLRNWQQMTRQMGRLAAKHEVEARQSHGWLGLGIGTGSKIDGASKEVERWHLEEDEIELKRQKTASLLSQLRSTTSPYGMISTLEG